MNQLQELNKEIKMTSLEVVDLINKFRAEEGRKAELTHCDFMKKIRKEIKSLELAGYKVNEVNFSLVKYKDKKGEYRDCYKLTRDGVLQMASSESAIVRAKVIEYINALENKIVSLEDEKANLLLTIYNGGTEAVVATRELVDMETKRLKEVVTSSQRIEDSRQVINRVIRTIASSRRYHGQFAVCWSDFYSILNYKLNININKRKGDKSILDKLTKKELKQAEIIAKCWAEELHVDLNLELSNYKNK